MSRPRYTPLQAEVRLLGLVESQHKLLPQEVKDVQEALNVLKESNAISSGAGKEDGVPGPITGYALHAFIAQHPEVNIHQLNPTFKDAVEHARNVRRAARQVMEPVHESLATNTKPLPQTRVVVIDAGHGDLRTTRSGHPYVDTGGDPHITGKTEEQINRAISEKVAKILTKDGYTVELSHRDTTGKFRGNMQQAFNMRTDTNPNAEVFLSLHADNAGRPTGAAHAYLHDRISGKPHDPKLITFKHESEKLAHELEAAFGHGKNSKLRYDNNAVVSPVLHNKARAAVLFEAGNMDNLEERKELTTEDGQERIARKIAAAIHKSHPIAPHLPMDVKASRVKVLSGETEADNTVVVAPPKVTPAQVASLNNKIPTRF